MASNESFWGLVCTFFPLFLCLLGLASVCVFSQDTALAYTKYGGLTPSRSDTTPISRAQNGPKRAKHGLKWPILAPHIFHWGEPGPILNFFQTFFSENFQDEYTFRMSLVTASGDPRSDLCSRLILCVPICGGWGWGTILICPPPLRLPPTLSNTFQEYIYMCVCVYIYGYMDIWIYREL